ncbi:hypothetical protein SAMN06298216_4430 [Spirosomataceae bacterium TFI 002]|nr:hypothetical protein SAMN06298216_4430 [Spirosomataceae bacterium TFI 002]
MVWRSYFCNVLNNSLLHNIKLGDTSALYDQKIFFSFKIRPINWLISYFKNSIDYGLM